MTSAVDTAAGVRLLETKFYIPTWRSGLVSRPRLIERMSARGERRLTLVSAPAGFGKTTLLAEWLANTTAGTRAVAWVSLDAADSEPTLFWLYVITALDRAHRGAGTRALELLQAPQPPAIEVVLRTLVNEIDGIDADVILLLDDYHAVESAAVDTGLAFLLDHLPRRLHIVMATRTDPRLPLARLRARGELTELRAADLRFTPDEATAFLNQVMALDLSAQDSSTLESRTEGWIAGLKLAALSIRERGDSSAFIAAFSGDDRHVADYLVEEVLETQPARIRNFLLATSILDRLSASLCDAVSADGASQQLLEDLEKRNLFVVPLDNRRVWYRYHHLFADVLHTHALREDAAHVRSCHRRASAWYEQNGAPADAIRHALAGEDFERAAGLLEKHSPANDRSHEARRWLERAKALPAALIRARPVLNMAYAWALLNGGELNAAEPHLDDVARWLDANAQHLQDAAQSDRLRALPAELASARGYLAQVRGDTAATVQHAARALELIPAPDALARATGAALLALAQWSNGELEAAHRTFRDAQSYMRRAGNERDAVRGQFVLGDIRVAQGRLQEAVTTYERGLELANAIERTGLEIDGLYLGLSEVYCERGDLVRASELLLTLLESSRQAEYTLNRERWCTAMARVRRARGDFEGALELLAEAAALDAPSPLPRPRPIAALRARVWLAQGRIDDAVAWARDRALSVADELSYLREFEHMTYARVLMAQQTAPGERHAQQALRLLERLAMAAEAGGRGGSVIEILVLQSVAQYALGNARAALEPLQRALALGEPEGYLRVFVDEGVPMRDLLRNATARGIAPGYTSRLLAALDEPPAEPLHAQSAQLLTARELVILRLIAAGLRNQEIADQLFISPATVKRHIANTYGKLGVTHRTEALARAQELNLLQV